MFFVLVWYILKQLFTSVSMKESQLSDGFYGKGVKNVWLFYTADSDEK